MKSSIQSLLPLALLFATSLAAPTPAQAEGPSFPITDLLENNLTIAEYTKELEEAQQTSTRSISLSKRQFNGDTYNQLTDGTPCRAITLIFARGTTQEGNVGTPDSEGPVFFNAVAKAVGGTSRLAVQGVTYPANVLGFLAGGDAAGATTMYNLINTVCPTPHYDFSVEKLTCNPRPPHNALRPRSSCQDTARAPNSYTLLRKGFRPQWPTKSVLVSSPPPLSLVLLCAYPF
jgi:hypothetical protein